MYYEGGPSRPGIGGGASGAGLRSDSPSEGKNRGLARFFRQSEGTVRLNNSGSVGLFRWETLDIRSSAQESLSPQSSKRSVQGPDSSPRIGNSGGSSFGRVAVGGGRAVDAAGELANQVGAVAAPRQVGGDDDRHLVVAGAADLLECGRIAGQVDGVDVDAEARELLHGRIALRGLRCGEDGDGHMASILVHDAA